MNDCPRKYKEICEQFVREYYSRCKWQLENNFLVQLADSDEAQRPILDPLSTPFGRQVSEIARAAAGELADDYVTRDVMTMAIQNLCEQLFAQPGLVYAYTVPPAFWSGGPFGRMVRDANFWAKGDEMITLTAAAEMLGESRRYVGHLIKWKGLTIYIDEAEKNPRKNRRVSRLEVEHLQQGREAKRREGSAPGGK